MAITVTATQSGASTANGMALTVKVLTGAASTQNGATANSETVTAPQLAITPNATGSWVYGAVTNDSVNTSYTANGSTTFSQNVPDATNGNTYGTFRSTSTTTSGTPVTVGASAPTETSGHLLIAMAEILASGTLAEDASSPAGVNTTSAITVTTASFSPPAGSLLVAMVSSDSNGALTMTVSGGSLSWSQLVGTGTNNLSSVWIAQIASAGLFVPDVNVIQAVKRSAYY